MFSNDGFIMTKNDFYQKFQFSSLNDSLHQYQHHAPLKPAAVLIALTEVDEQLFVVLTKRASHLKHHPGQISFPGGKMEDFDAGFVSAAIREAEEEIGLNSDNIDIVGQLLPYETISGYIVTPIIAFIVCTILTTFSIGLLIAFVIKRINKKPTELQKKVL